MQNFNLTAGIGSGEKPPHLHHNQKRKEYTSKWQKSGKDSKRNVPKTELHTDPLGDLTFATVCLYGPMQTE